MYTPVFYKKVFFACWVILLLITGNGEHLLFAQKLPFVNYTTSQGMVHNRTHTMGQDGKGFIWVGTDLGICRYDGRTFKHYPGSGNPYYTARYCLRVGSKVVFTVDRMGLAFCEGDSVRFMPVKDFKPGEISGAVALTDTSFLFNDFIRGVVWLDTAGHARSIKIPGTNPEGNAYVDMFRDSRGMIWLLTNVGLVLLPPNDYAHPVFPPQLQHIYMNVVREDPQGNIYVGSHEGIVMYTKKDCANIAQAVPKVIFPTKAEVTCIDFDKEHNVWFSTIYNGIFKYDIKTRKFHNYSIDNGLISQNTWSILVDRENNIWVGTENGISKLPTQNFITFDFSRTNYQNVKSGIAWNDSVFLFSNLINVYQYKGDSISLLKGFQSMPGYRTRVLQRTPDNRLWVSSSTPKPSGDFDVNTTAYELRGNALVNGLPLAALPNGAKEVFIEQKALMLNSNEMIINTSSGLKLYKHNSLYNLHMPVIDTHAHRVTGLALCMDKTFWAVWDYKSMAHYRLIPAIGSQPYMIQPLGRIRESQLDSQAFHALLVDSSNNIWAYSKISGVTLLRTNKNGNVVKIEHLPPSWFSSGIVNEIAEDGWHRLWVATSAGLDEMHFENGRLRIQKDLYGSMLCGKQIFFVKHFNGKIVVGTTGCAGILSLTGPETYKPPLIYLADIKVNELSRKELLNKSTPRLHTDENNIRFSFTGLNFKDEKKIRYSYRLEGIDKYWSQPAEEYTTTYSHLPPGHYTFRVKALASSGQWSVGSADFSFIIIQPFYTRWWFIAIIVIITAGIIYSIYRYRINQLLAIQRIRQNISKDLHDDIGATVSSINILANMAKSNVLPHDKRNQFLETIQEESRHVSESLSDIVWSINPKNDSLAIMFARMQRYASELFEARNIAYEFILPPHIDELQLPMNKRQHVYLIFKEAVNNLVKYSGAQHAHVTLQVKRNTLTMIVADDGKGFDIHKLHAGNGVLNMKKRAQEAGAYINIQSQPGQGTIITFSIPF